jgi:hypothetical protein
VRETNCPHFRDRGMISFIQLLRDAQCCLPVLAQEAQEILPRDEIGLSRFDYIGPKLIRFSCNRRGQAQDVTQYSALAEFLSYNPSYGYARTATCN